MCSFITNRCWVISHYNTSVRPSVYKILPSSSISCHSFLFIPENRNIIYYFIPCQPMVFLFLLFVCIFASHTCLTSQLLLILCECPHQVRCLCSIKSKIDIIFNSALLCSFLILFLLVTPITMFRNILQYYFIHHLCRIS